MAFLVERARSADGVWQPDYDEHPNGVQIWEKSENAAVKAYARRVLGGEDALREGDQFELYPIGDAKTIHVAGRRIALKFAEGDAPDA